MMETSQQAPTAAPQTAVIIPHLDRLADTAACCASLAEQRAAAALLDIDDLVFLRYPDGGVADDLAVFLPNVSA